MENEAAAVKDYLQNLQANICAALEQVEGEARFSSEIISSPTGGVSMPRVLSHGQHLEKVAVHFTHSIGSALPAAATERNPAWAGKPFEAMAVSMITHPVNPYVPTMHANLRFFLVGSEHWYFGGGFDLTPCYPFEEDAVHWHQQAKEACDPFGADLYQRCKERCDEYFFLPHRGETRGVGGLFFDDWTEGGFERSFDFVRSIGDHIVPGYLPILERRKDTDYTQSQKDFQLYRRGRYVEFNLLIDRGTRYGLQSGRNVESILASLPPVAHWEYKFQPEPGSPEEGLASYLVPRDWLSS